MVADEPDFPTDAVFAHSLPGRHQRDWELLPDHLRRVAERARAFGARFGAGELAWLTGGLHDIGKVSGAFQRRIRGAPGQVNHAFAGAREAERLFGGPEALFGRLAAFAIAGHHAGLSDGAGPSGLEEKLRLDVPDYAGWQAQTGALPQSAAPRLLGRSRRSAAYHLAFLGRMIFSCLVDADFLETERFYLEAEGQAPDRGGHAPLTELKERLDRHLAPFAGRPGVLNGHRAAILAHARAKAALAPGLFTMTVPTGGGKTLASLAFALDHATAHGLDRVVYVVPYTSIIEQTADVFRRALADETGDAPEVLEHHGTFDWSGREEDRDDPGALDALARLRRASENWDVPVVVTTAVQFFESLHASRTGRCRKLHNLARSVVVLDEAQTLPTHLLRPCLAALDELAACYGTSVVLCTATQPAVAAPRLPGGLPLDPARELAPEPAALYRALKRVTVEQAGYVADEDLAARFAAQPRMLCIVNSRKHAQALFELIRGVEGARHLSTLMCPAHRRAVLAEARAALKAGGPVRLVSTSLIKAGVDIDLPEVWRAETGLDSIAQAAGRANREGGPTPGRVVVFTSPEHTSPPQFRPQIAAMREALRLHGDDPLGLEAVQAYFKHLYWTKADRLDAATLDGDPYPILPALEEAFELARFRLTTPYDRVAQAFRMIDETGEPIIVPWRGGADPHAVETLLERLRHAAAPPGEVLRALQQYTVTIPRRHLLAMMADGLVEEAEPGRYPGRFRVAADTSALPEGERLYREATGLQIARFGDDPLGIVI